MQENDIISDACYLIKKFNDNGKKVTNMQIQKLMYFFEAYYMNLHDDISQVYDCNFNAWAFGPVAIPLYKYFRKFGSDEIKLKEEEIVSGNKISYEKKKVLDCIFNAFKETEAMDLVKLTHMSSSPWYEVWKKNGEKVGYGDNMHIDKSKSKIWFKETFDAKNK